MAISAIIQAFLPRITLIDADYGSGQKT